MGNEYLFQAHAEQNVETLNEAGRDEDRRELPALLNTLGNEYPTSAAVRVMHHSELLAELVRERPHPAAERRAVDH